MKKKRGKKEFKGNSQGLENLDRGLERKKEKTFSVSLCFPSAPCKIDFRSPPERATINFWNEEGEEKERVRVEVERWV